MKHIVSFVIKHIPRKYLQLFAHHGAKIMSLGYLGNNVECPVCEKHYKKFLPYGRKPPRENALCPNCLALERHRLMWLYLKEKTNFFTHKNKVLHIAPELCFIKRFESLENLEYITGDLESPLAKVKMDVHDIPFDENSFDVVFCNHVMEHVDDDIHCMKEIHRVLKPGGWAIIQSPQDINREDTFEDPTITDPKAREEAYWQSDHVRLYGRDYGKRLEKAGFNVIEDDFVKSLPKEKVSRFALPSGEIVYLCQKQA
ncbi:methyltransferase domain-containing protein [Aureibacter tunicatorum]|uniref:SAM-dependent methyltransferase n=1 Tax=Aureibacter tunicatorum TaxID=866807 RepID=A0AAE4BTK0_9BACT|nr:methyltransferase domain-containing protein [Aureibacter tunicatorum]MDR6240776.1 SAM-dependent methyltransferase [Aureibacter tunicatorum]BDD06891.1 SAM-dependent methyltransferase [Aureibacter tunicatorum]